MISCHQSPSLNTNRKVFNLTMCCCRLSFIVLVIASTSEGQHGDVITPAPGPAVTQNGTTVVPPEGQNGTTRNNSSATTPNPLPGELTALTTNSSVISTTSNNLTPTLTTLNENVAGSPTTTVLSEKTPTVGSGTTKSPGYVILGLMIVVIIILIVILFFFRRASRTYSFNLHRPSPDNQIREPTGKFDLIYQGDLAVPFEETEYRVTASSPELNGTSGHEQAQEQNPNGVVVSNSATDDDPADSAYGLMDGDLLLELDEQQSESNNHPSVCSSDPSVEINLDEAPSSDQLLAMQFDASSVIPFDIFPDDCSS